MKKVVLDILRYAVVYATTGVVGLGILAWLAYRARRIQPEVETIAIADDSEMLAAA